MAAATLLTVSCSSNRRPAVPKVAPVVLAELALAPADLDNMYVIEQDRYLDEDGNPSQTPTHEFERQMRVKGTAAAEGSAAAATVVLVTVGEPGVDKAQEFVDAADDESVGPPNLADFIQQRIPASHDVHAELIPDFPVYGDDTIANRLTWQQTVDGQDQAVTAFGVYVRSGGRLALVALRAPADTSGGEPDALYRQTEAAVKRQAEKLKSQGPSLIGPR